ncbi:hypothetical protein K2X33_02675 [bacterium]|nr:hypothetical protein [bacterium]
MNIKSIPNNPPTISTVKEASDEQKQTAREPRKPGRTRAKGKTAQAAETETEDSEISAEAEDETLRTSQPIDSQTVIELRRRTPALLKRVAKFPTPKPADARPETAKKLDKNA